MPASPSMAHPPDCSLSFNQIRAKFAGSSTVCEAKSSRSEPTLETEENGKEEEDAMDNVVAMRKRLFENHRQQKYAVIEEEERHPTHQVPYRPAPPPPPPSLNDQAPPPIPQHKPKLKIPTLSVPTPLLLMEGDTSETHVKDNDHQEEGGGAGTMEVKSMVERLNRIGHRPFEPKLPGMGQIAERMMTYSRLKAQEQMTELAEEVGTDGEDDDEKCDESSVGERSEVRTTLDDGDGDDDEATGGGSRRLSTSLSGNDTVHQSVLQEMRNKGMFKKFAIMAGLPSEVGKLRAAAPSSKKSARQGCASDPHPAEHAVNTAAPSAGLHRSATSASEGVQSAENACSSLLSVPKTPAIVLRKQDTAAKTASVISSQSGSTVGDEAPDEQLYVVPEYDCGGDQKEAKRLRELHSVALEFYRMQHTFVVLLQHIGENYPRYLAECQNRSKEKWLDSGNNVIERIANHFHLIMGVHKMFLEDFAAKIIKWDSRKPDLAEVLQRKAEFLKVCSSFLKVKRTLATEFQQALDADRELASATRRFEQGVLNEDLPGGSGTSSSSSSSLSQCGSVMNLRGISIVIQLDAVHQNVVRYKLLMERYRKYLPDSLVEANIADEALKKLTAVSNTVNEFLSDADADSKLMELHRKLQGLFDVFAPGRRLLHEGELQRQTRKDLQLRYLILFSDTLLICRYGGTLASISDSFDADSLYKIPIDKVRLEVEDHDDYEREFTVHSPKKSSAFVAKSKRERDVWVRRISDARKSAIERKTTTRKKRKSIGGGGGAGHRKVSDIQTNKITTNDNGTSQFYCSATPAVSADKQLEVQQAAAVSAVDTLACSACELVEEVEDGDEDDEFAIAGCSTTPAVDDITNGSVKPQPSSSSSAQSLFTSSTKALWIPDNKATKCLMNGCNTTFNFVRRKHHCRQCGWLICTHCVGRAPVPSEGFEQVKVCPQCFYDNRRAFEQGLLFPPAMVRRVAHPETADAGAASLHGHKVAMPLPPTQGNKKFSLGDLNLRISYDAGARLEHPADLFIPPDNGPLKKAKIPVKGECPAGERRIVSGKVYLRTTKGSPALRWASLTAEFSLQFYRAEFDDQPAEHFFIYGYSMSHSESEDAGTLIELTHHNQIRTERKEDQIGFHVLHSGSAQKWLAALRRVLQIEQPLEEDEDNGGS